MGLRFWGFQLFARSMFEGTAGFVDSANTVFPDFAIWVRMAISANFVFPGFQFFGVCVFHDFREFAVSGISCFCGSLDFSSGQLHRLLGLLMFGLLGFRKRWEAGVCGL